MSVRVDRKSVTQGNAISITRTVRRGWRVLGVVLLGFAPLATGCGSKEVDRLQVFPVEGKVTLQGQPLPNALVVLHPRGTKDPRYVPARGQTDETGAFKISSYDAHDGAPEGEYAVTVEYYRPVDRGNGLEPGPNVLSPKLASPQTTDIVVKVAANPNTLPPVEVSR